MSAKTARLKKGWKDSQKRKRDWKKVRLGLVVLVALLSIFVLGALVRFTKTLLSPWNSERVERGYSWDATFNLNLVIKAKDTSLVSYNPVEKKVTIINLPEVLYLDVPYGLGKWQLRSVFALGETEGRGGGALLGQTLSLFFGLPIDGFLEFRGDLSQRDGVELVEAFRQNPFYLASEVKKIKSDLTLWEILRFGVNLSSVRFDKVAKIDLVHLNLLEAELLADAEPVFTSDPIKLDSALQEFADERILKEHLSVSIFNATDKPQLAQKAKRIISNLGGNVITTSNSTEGAKRSYVFGEESKTYLRLLQIFDLGCSKDPQCDKIDPSDLGLASIRAQVTLVLGEDYIK